MQGKKKLYIICGYLAIVIITVAAILISGQRYTIYVHNPYESDQTYVEYSKEGIAEAIEISRYKDYTKFVFESIDEGQALVNAVIVNGANQKETTGMFFNFTVLPTGVIYATGFEYGGHQFALYGMTAMMLYSFVICLVLFKKRLKTQFYSNKTMLDLALFVFFGMQSLIYLSLSAWCVIKPESADGWQIYNLAGFTMTAIFIVSIPLLVIFAGFLSISNLSLIRHEGFRKNNFFGILISAALFFGSLACMYAAVKNPNSIGMSLDDVKSSLMRCIISSAFVYFECILFAAVVCTLYAARHKPEYNKDFIVILGCKVAKDGRPYPLLQKRIDRAIDFYNEQLKQSGKQAHFIPSGGKGSDEVISEAESIKNYLIEKGIDEKLIHTETKSTTTLENMIFSKEIADGIKKDANILFSTTNYHVFRSGMFSAKAGMKADGVGAKTKWYFWPNAQMREFIGILASEWKINLLFIAITVSLSTLFANIPVIINWIAN